jgi:NAD(P)-dependent dehydrogenase (short-subunit alcohol dehydrogenase family)
VIGDLASEQETRALAEQGNGLGWMDAIIHNAGVYADQQRFPTLEGDPRLLFDQLHRVVDTLKRMDRAQ